MKRPSVRGDLPIRHSIAGQPRFRSADVDQAHREKVARLDQPEPKKET